MLQNVYTVVLIIFFVNIIYVTLSTVRMILTLKGRRYIAAGVSLVEISVYVVGLSLVLDNLNAIQNVVAYALGFGIGVIVGTKIEEKMALGYITVNVISSDPDLDFSGRLRAKGYGVTSWLADGRDGHRLALQILTPRKYELKLYEDIKEIDPKAFIIAYEPKQIFGGFWVKQVRRGRLFNHHRKAAAQEKGTDTFVPAKAETMAEPAPHPADDFTSPLSEHQETNKDKSKQPLEARTNERADGARETDSSKLPPRVRVQTEQNQEREVRDDHKPESGHSPGPGSSMKEREHPKSPE